MENVDLVGLELQLETLLQSHNKLKGENTSLRQKLTKVSQERAELADKNKKAIAKIKRIISQLRSEIQ